MSEVLRIRRGLAILFLAFGGLHSLAAVLGLGGRAYFAAYLLFIVGGLGYLFSRFRRFRTFYYETLADYLIGLALFVALMSPYAGIFLIAYGIFLVYRS